MYKEFKADWRKMEPIENLRIAATYFDEFVAKTIYK